MQNLVPPVHLTAGLKFFKKNGKPLRSESVAVTADPVHIRALREEVTWHVINEAQRLHPEINFHFNAQIQKVDLAQQCVHVPLAGSTDLVQACSIHTPVLHETSFCRPCTKPA